MTEITLSIEQVNKIIYDIFDRYNISEDVVFELEAMINHRSALLEQGETDVTEKS